MDRAGAKAELFRMFDELDPLRARLRQVTLPHPRSPLADDDRRWTFSPLSALTMAKLGACVDHLQSVRVLCEAESFHPMATYTLTRSALLTASQAAWALAPADPLLRQSRGLALAREIDRHRGNYLRAVGKTPAALPRPLCLALLNVLMHEIGAKWIALDLPSPGGTGDTDVIAAAARAMQPGQRDWEWQAVAHWRGSSSDAHGNLFGATLRSPVAARPTGDGLAEISTGGDVLQTYHHFYVPFQTLLWAFRRWDRLATAP